MDNILISSDEIKEYNNIDLDIKAKQFSSSGFWYYTSADTAEKILNSHSFYVSCYNKMNDLNEIRLHESEKDIVHALCFVNSGNEKIPMWYLYGGITGEGISIGFTPSMMLSFIRSIKSVFTVNDDPNNKDKTQELVVGKDVEFQYGWVFYRKPTKSVVNYSEVFYKNKWYTVKDRVNFEKDNYFIKDYGWNYEKEFRLVFINRTGTPHERLKVEFDESLLKKIRIRTAPEMTEEKLNGFLTTEGALKWSKAQIIPSDLGINMDLLKKNKDSIIEYICQKTNKISKAELEKLL